MHTTLRSTGALLALLIAAPLWAADRVAVSGTVQLFDESFMRVAQVAGGCAVSLRGDTMRGDTVRGDTVRVSADAAGRYAISVPRGEPVNLVVEGPGLVRSLQPTRTFGADTAGERLLAVPVAMDVKSDAIQLALTGIIFSQEVGQKRDRSEGKVLGLAVSAPVTPTAPLVGATVRLETADPRVAARREKGELFVAPAGSLPGDEGFFIMLNIPPGPGRLVTSDFPESRTAHARYLLDPLDIVTEAGAVTVALMTGKPNPWTPPPEERPAPVRFVETKWSCGYVNESKNVDPNASLALGSAVGVGDLDGNGLLDLLVTGGLGYPNGVLLQKSPGVFERVDNGLGSPAPEKVAVALGDLDNDGDLDVYQSSLGPDQLFENVGRGKFVDVTAKSFVADPGNARTAAMADLDADGRLDLFCGNYDLGSRIDMDSLNNPGQGNTLHQNLGRWRFREVAQEAGVRQTGLAFAQAFVDFDGDGLDDLVLAHDHGKLKFFKNRSIKGVNGQPGKIVFEDVSEKVGFTGSGSWMGVAVGDFDNDGRLDIFVTNTGMAEPMYDPIAPESHFWHALYHNDGVKDGLPHFTDVAREAGVADAGWGWGCRFEDFDNDGFLDLVLVTNMFVGAIGATPGSMSILGMMPPGGIGGTEGFVFFNDGHGHFHDSTRSAGVRVPHDARSVATPDLDGDGWPDLVVGNERGPLQTYRNLGGKPNGWVELELEGNGTTINRDGIGAIVTLAGARGRWMRHRSAGDGFKSSASPVLHFGVGADRGPFTATVHWPGGTAQDFPGLTAGKRHRLRSK